MLTKTIVTLFALSAFVAGPDLVHPVPESRLVGEVGAPRPGARTHGGTDYGAPTGTPVVAPFDGVVIWTGWAGGYGRTVTLARYEEGQVWLFAHLSAVDVSAGQVVEQGQRLGAVGSTGRSSGPHLHLGVAEARCADRRGVFPSDGRLECVLNPQRLLLESFLRWGSHF